MQGRYWWELANNKCDSRFKKRFMRNLIDGKKPLEYDENLSFVIEEVKRQLKLGVLIPKALREFAVRIIERWWEEGHRWNQKGKGLIFMAPKREHYFAYWVVWRKMEKLKI